MLIRVTTTVFSVHMTTLTNGFEFLTFLKDGELGDDDHDEDGLRDPDPEGRVEKYIGLKVKVCAS